MKFIIASIHLANLIIQILHFIRNIPKYYINYYYYHNYIKQNPKLNEYTYLGSIVSKVKPILKSEKSSQILDFLFNIFLLNQNETDIKINNNEIKRVEFQINHNYSSNQTFKLFYKSVDTALNLKIEKVIL